MSAVKQTEEIPQRQLRLEPLTRPFRVRKKPRQPTHQAAGRTSVLPAWQSKQICALLPARPFEQPERHATPETPAAKIFLRQPLRPDMMVNLQIGQIHSLRATGQQTPVKLFIFTGQQSLVRTTKPRRVESDFQQH